MPQLSVFFDQNESQPMSTIANHSQREMPLLAVMRTPVDVPVEFIRACKDELHALNLCMNLSNLSDETIRDTLGIDKGHFSRLRKGRGNFPANKRIALMQLCGNRAPVQFEAEKLNCDLVDKSKDALIHQLEQQIQQLRAA
jgi:hypothetical protein